MDFLASGLRPRASVVVVCGVGVVVDAASLASGFRPCASEVLWGFSVGASALYPSSRSSGAASLLVTLRRWRCVGGGGVGGVSALSA